MRFAADYVLKYNIFVKIASILFMLIFNGVTTWAFISVVRHPAYPLREIWLMALLLLGGVWIVWQMKLFSDAFSRCVIDEVGITAINGFGRRKKLLFTDIVGFHYRRTSQMTHLQQGTLLVLESRGEYDCIAISNRMYGYEGLMQTLSTRTDLAT